MVASQDPVALRPCGSGSTSASPPARPREPDARPRGPGLGLPAGAGGVRRGGLATMATAARPQQPGAGAPRGAERGGAPVARIPARSVRPRGAARSGLPPFTYFCRGSGAGRGCGAATWRPGARASLPGGWTFRGKDRKMWVLSIRIVKSPNCTKCLPRQTYTHPETRKIKENVGAHCKDCKVPNCTKCL